MIFQFVVAHCRWLARLPLLPQLFDALLLAWTLLTDRRKLCALEVLEVEARRIFGAQLRTHRFGGTEFHVGGRELAHVHGNGLFDAHLRAPARDAVIARRMALPHHVLPRSSWVSFWIRTENDVATAIELMRLAREARDGTSPKCASYDEVVYG